jgi:hypothetical protein
VALALAATLVQALPFASMAPRAAADEADRRVTETEASAAARKSGKQIEVLSLAQDFGITGNRNNANLAAFREVMSEHMTAADTNIYRFNYRRQGQAVGFIDSSTNKMVMLRADTGKFWSAFQLSDSQFGDIVDRGFLW